MILPVVVLVIASILMLAFDIPSLWPQLQATLPIAAQLIQVAILWIVAGYLVKIMSDVFSRIIEKAGKVPHNVSMLTQKLLRYMIYAVAAMWTLSIFGLTGAVQGLLIGAGFAGIVIGFAAQDTLGNLFAGITILMDRPFKVGDWIHLKNQDTVGFVSETSFRSVTIIGPDNTPISIPNIVINRESIINYTEHRLRRFFLDVGISYESDIGKAMKVITRTLQKDPATAKQGIKGEGYFAPIEVIVTKFSDSSVDLQARVFVDSRVESIFQAKSRMLSDIKKELTKAKIEIPYPRRYVIMGKKK